MAKLMRKKLLQVSVNYYCFCKMDSDGEMYIWFLLIGFILLISGLLPSGRKRQIMLAIAGGLTFVYLRNLQEKSASNEGLVDNELFIATAFVVIGITIFWNQIINLFGFGNQAPAQPIPQPQSPNPHFDEQEATNHTKLYLLITYGSSGLIIGLMLFLYILFCYITSQISPPNYSAIRRYFTSKAT